MIVWNRKTTIMFAINLCSDYFLMTKENGFKLFFFVEENILNFIKYNASRLFILCRFQNDR